MNKKTITIEVNDYSDVFSNVHEEVEKINTIERRVSKKNIEVANEIRSQMLAWFAETFNPFRATDKYGNELNTLVYNKDECLYSFQTNKDGSRSRFETNCFSDRFTVEVTFNLIYVKHDISFFLCKDGKAGMSSNVPVDSEKFVCLIKIWDSFKRACEDIANQIIHNYEDDAKRKLNKAYKLEETLATFII